MKKKTAEVLTLLFIITAVFFFSGCCSSRLVAFDPAHRQDIQTIGIITVQEFSQRYFCYDSAYRTRSTTSGSITEGGIAEALIAATIEVLVMPVLYDLVGIPKIGERLAGLNKAFTSQGFAYSREIYNSFEYDLKKAGYEVIQIKARRAYADRFMEDYCRFGDQADAYLDVAVQSIGCYQLTDTSYKGYEYCYRPLVSLNVRLVKARSNKTLYEEYLVCGYPPHCGYTKIQQDGIYAWKTFEDMTGNAPVFVEGVRQAIKKIARKVAAELNPPMKPTEIEGLAFLQKPSYRKQ